MWVGDFGEFGVQVQSGGAVVGLSLGVSVDEAPMIYALYIYGVESSDGRLRSAALLPTCPICLSITLWRDGMELDDL